jgi:hypothetical protein
MDSLETPKCYHRPTRSRLRAVPCSLRRLPRCTLGLGAGGGISASGNFLRANTSPSQWQPSQSTGSHIGGGCSRIGRGPKRSRPYGRCLCGNLLSRAQARMPLVRFCAVGPCVVEPFLSAVGVGPSLVRRLASVHRLASRPASLRTCVCTDSHAECPVGFLLLAWESAHFRCDTSHKRPYLAVYLGTSVRPSYYRV